MLIGYARVSTEEQNPELQRDALIKYGVEVSRIYEEHISGVKQKRPQLEACKKALRPGDSFIVWKLDRLGRSVKDLLGILDYLAKNNIEFVSLQDNIDTSNAAGKMMLVILAAFAEFEHNMISDRTKAGLAVARKNGWTGGQPPCMKQRDIKALAALKSTGEYTIADLCERFGHGKSTIYKYLKIAEEKGLLPTVH